MEQRSIHPCYAAIRVEMIRTAKFSQVVKRAVPVDEVFEEGLQTAIGEAPGEV